jgi:exodeoxyribonuclease-3
MSAPPTPTSPRAPCPPNDALVRPETRAAFNALIWTGLTDALRALHPTETLYTFWDYQAGAWDRNSACASTTLCSPRASPSG